MSRENSRWTYTEGSRPEGVIVYDDDTKLHSHHDTDPARGQHSAFDLVRLHKFGHLDAESKDAPITSRPSYLAMVEFANQLGEIRAGRAEDELTDMGPAPTEGELINANSTPGPQPDPSRRFRVYSASEFGSGPPMDWIVRQLLPRAELAVIYGESGSGKSFLALDICGAVQRGLQWRARRTIRGHVAYVCAEGAGGFKARLNAYARGHSVGLDELPSVISDAPNLLDPKDAAALTHSILTWAEQQSGGVDVIVIDTLSATTPGGNENSGEDMGLVLSHCKLLHQRTGALVVLIHHSGKDATRGARGWSGLRAAADAEIEITRNGDYRTATVTKMKDGTDGESLVFKLKVVDLGENAEGERESSCIVEHVEQSAAPEVGKPNQRLGPREKIMHELLKVMAPTGTVAEEDLFNGYKAKVPKGDGRDQRLNHARQALTGLVAKRMAYMQSGDRVSLTSLVKTGGEEEWLK